MATWFPASAVVPQLRAEWNLSSTGAAWLTIAVQLGFVAGALASSLLNVADVFSPQSVILAGALGAAAANALLGAAGSAAPGILLRLATGFFLAGVYPPALKLMATWFRQRRGLALGTIVGALTLGWALPHLVNGLGGLDWHVVIRDVGAESGRRPRRPVRGRRRPVPVPEGRLRTAACGWRRPATSATRGAA
jgi:MFS family permease